ncbi:cyclic GMP-AMP synthase-like [Ostrea edulis]|uniref:cyclic GMP-AMP synthase-like n=1 Tax=Ostrea edulis TaxID=37623 RepID=UPI0024AFE4CA|nr:cyclic GMP-AMP synthase-like [Ostrea edulis]
MLKCKICHKEDFKNEHGLHIHESKVHGKGRESSTPLKGDVRPKQFPSATRYRSKGEGQNGGGSSDLPASHKKPQSTPGKKTSATAKDVNENYKTSSPRIKSSSSTTRETKTEHRTANHHVRPPTADMKDKVIARHVHSAPDQRRKGDGQNDGGRRDLPPSDKNPQSTPGKKKPSTMKDGKENDKTFPSTSYSALNPPKSQEGLARSFTALDFRKYIAMQEASIKRSKHETQIRVERVNKFLENLQYIMERTSDIPLDVLKSGSYYDRTKIDYDDEFDFMFYPKANMEADFTHCPPGFCKIKKSRTTNKSLDSLCNENGYLVPNRFKEKMFNIFEDCIKSGNFREGRRTKRKPRLVGSPAFTVLYDLQVRGVNPIDIDLVPAIRVEGWPPTAREIRPQWLRESNAKHAMKCFHVVTKTFPDEHPDGDLLWRVSFSHAEKELILHANQYDKGCRKGVFKLLKKVKENIKYGSPSEIDKFCSYHLKMFMLKFYDNHDSFDKDQKETLFKQSIKELTKCVRNGKIENYFIPKDNILHFVSKKEKNFVAEKLQTFQEEYNL